MRFQMIFYLLWAGIAFAAPPWRVPIGHYNAFTMDGQIPVLYAYYDNTRPRSTCLVYDFDTIEMYRKRALAKELNYYGQTDLFLYSALDNYRSLIEGKKVAIMGSDVPWYEAIVLAYGGIPVTIEYNRIVSKHPLVRTITPQEYASKPETFDAILSISSYEHDGLGRYGDPIQPNGDLRAMEETKKMLNPGGVLFLAVPIGKDCLVWNAHRIYGAKRLPLLLAGWAVLETWGFQESDLQREGFEQPVFVLGLAQ